MDGAAGADLHAEDVAITELDRRHLLLPLAHRFHRAHRIAELRRFVPDGVAPPNTPIGDAVSPTFFAAEVEGIAAALDAYVAAPTNRGALDEALGRVRALRGISALKELPPLADVVDALEHAHG